MKRHLMIVIALLAAACILFAAAAAESLPSDFAVGITWMDADGKSHTLYANEITYPGYEGSFWL